jgi:Fe-S-cluster containining protein
MSTEINVPCNGCTLCCKGDAVRLLPGDGLNYFVEPHPTMPGEWMLAHKPNHDCIYLGDTGCTIHGKAPRMCMEMDCRVIAGKVTKKKAQRMRGMMEIWQRGKELLAQK